MKNSFYAFVRRLAAVIVGLVFFWAGMFKLQDPVGTALKVGDYLQYFHLGFLSPLSKTLGFVLSLLETICGAALCTGVWRKITALVTSGLLLAFTVVTAILYVKNPSMDCGCFGEAIKLSHAQSFYKNLILCALAAFAFVPFNDMEQPRKIKYIAFGFAALCSAGLGVYSLGNIPLMDYSELCAGSRFISSEQISSGEEDASDGVVFSMVSAEGWSRDDVFTNGRYMAICVNEPSSMSLSEWTGVNTVIENSNAAGINPLILMAGNDFSMIPEFIDATVYSADPRRLSTLNRSDCGLTYIGGGVVVKKWTLRNAPSAREMSEFAQSNSVKLSVERDILPGTVFECLIIVPIAVMLLL